MDKLLQQLIDYFNNTPRDVVEKEWHEYDKYNEIGPTVNEFLMFDCKKQKKEKFWIEATGTVDYYFSKFGCETLSLDFAEKIHSKHGIKPIEDKKNYYRILDKNGLIQWRPMAIYTFNDISIFKTVLKKYEEDFLIDDILKKYNITLEKFSSQDIDSKNAVECAKEIMAEVSTADFELYNNVFPLSLKPCIESCVKLLKKMQKKDEQIKVLIEEGEKIIKENRFLCYHDFTKKNAKYYE